MTEEQFWVELAKHRGKFEIEDLGRIRTTGECLCPLEAVAGEDEGWAAKAAQLLGSAVTEYNGVVQTVRVTGWAAVVMNAADTPLYELRSNRDRAVRRRLCEVLGLEEES